MDFEPNPRGHHSKASNIQSHVRFPSHRREVVLINQKTQRVYLAHKEKIPYRAAKSSKFIPKAMFLGAGVRPRWNRYGQCTFDGKIGIFPFINRVAAQRDSKNRPRGSIEIKPTELVSQDVYRNMLIQQLILALLRQWPSKGPYLIGI